MFELFKSPNPATGTTMPPSSTIKEANEHLQAMLKRIWDLEQRVKEQTELMNRRETEYALRMQNMERHKEADMVGMQREINKVKERCKELEGIVKERDVIVAYLLHRCSYLDEAASYVPVLDQLSQCLKNSSVAPPPSKRDTAKTPPPRPGTGTQEYTPDVPMAPCTEKYNSAEQNMKQKMTKPKYVQQYPDSVASVYAVNPSVALKK